MLFMNDFEYKNDRYGSSDSVRHEEERPSGDALVFSIIGLVSGVMSLSLSFFGYGSIFGMLCGAAAFPASAEDPVTISIYLQMPSDFVPEDNLFVEQIEKACNIKIEWQMPPINSYTESEFNTHVLCKFYKESEYDSVIADKIEQIEAQIAEKDDEKNMLRLIRMGLIALMITAAVFLVVQLKAENRSSKAEMSPKRRKIRIIALIAAGVLLAGVVMTSVMINQKDDELAVINELTIETDIC